MHLCQDQIKSTQFCYQANLNSIETILQSLNSLVIPSMNSVKVILEKFIQTLHNNEDINNNNNNNNNKSSYQLLLHGLDLAKQSIRLIRVAITKFREVILNCINFWSPFLMYNSREEGELEDDNDNYRLDSPMSIASITSNNNNHSPISSNESLLVNAEHSMPSLDSISSVDCDSHTFESISSIDSCSILSLDSISSSSSEDCANFPNQPSTSNQLAIDLNNNNNKEAEPLLPEASISLESIPPQYFDSLSELNNLVGRYQHLLQSTCSTIEQSLSFLNLAVISYRSGFDLATRQHQSMTNE